MVCIVVLLVCCKKVGSMSIFLFYSTAFCEEMYVIFYVMAVVAVGCSACFISADVIYKVVSFGSMM